MTRFFSTLFAGLFFAGAVYAQTPPTPTDLRVSAYGSGNTRIGAFLTWSAPSGTHQYRIYRSSNDSSNFAAIGTSTQRSYFDSTIVRGTRYYYYVKSFIGTTESNRSNIANILIPIPPPLPNPSPLTAVNAPSGFNPAVRLTWRGGRSSQWFYKIYRATNNANNFRSYASTSDTTYRDYGVRGDSTYYYYVRPTYSGDTTGTPRSNTASVLVVTPPRPRGTIRGTVLADSTATPIRNVSMSFYRMGTTGGGNHGGYYNAHVTTDSLGRYTALLDTGRYIIRANPPHSHRDSIRYVGEYFDNCATPSCATIVNVGENTTFTANFGLARYVPPTYNTISGVVRDTLNNPLRNARVSIIRTLQEMNFLASLGYVPGIGPEAFDFEEIGHCRGVVWHGRTDSLGRYSARVISNQNYIAMASKEGYLPEYWNNRPTPELADIIRLGNRDTSGIDFSLAVRPVPNNSIAGIVRDSLNTRVPSRIVLIPLTRNIPTRYGHTDSLGAYTITAVDAGRYFVFAMPFSGYGAAYYKAGAYGVTRRQDADTVNITGNVTGINVGVRPIRSSGLTSISGRIRSIAGAVIAGVMLTAQDQEGEVLGVGVTDASGVYSIDAVSPGVVTIVADRTGFNASHVDIVVAENNFTINNVNITMSPEGVTSVGGGTTPESFSLNQNYPNPFNPSTTISFELPVASRVSLQVFDVLGQQVASLVNNELAQGKVEVVWNGQDNAGRPVASGIYFYRLKATASVGGNEFSSIKKMLLLK
jgi:hypothetical protein